MKSNLKPLTDLQSTLVGKPIANNQIYDKNHVAVELTNFVRINSGDNTNAGTVKLKPNVMLNTFGEI